MNRHKLEQLSHRIGQLDYEGTPSSAREARRFMAEHFKDILGFALEFTEPPPKPQRTIADNYPAGGLATCEPCMFCEDHEELQAIVDTLPVTLDDKPIYCGMSVFQYCKRDDEIWEYVVGSWQDWSASDDDWEDWDECDEEDLPSMSVTAWGIEDREGLGRNALQCYSTREAAEAKEKP